jgi:hypothetical protein
MASTAATTAAIDPARQKRAIPITWQADPTIRLLRAPRRSAKTPVGTSSTSNARSPAAIAVAAATGETPL